MAEALDGERSSARLHRAPAPVTAVFCRLAQVLVLTD